MFQWNMRNRNDVLRDRIKKLESDNFRTIIRLESLESEVSHLQEYYGRIDSLDFQIYFLQKQLDEMKMSKFQKFVRYIKQMMR